MKLRYIDLDRKPRRYRGEDIQFRWTVRLRRYRRQNIYLKMIHAILTVFFEIIIWCAAILPESTAAAVSQCCRRTENEQRGSEQVSVKIKVSYSNQDELQMVLKQLGPLVKSHSISRNKEGRYKKAYIEMNDVKSQNLCIKK